MFSILETDVVERCFLAAAATGFACFIALLVLYLHVAR